MSNYPRFEKKMPSFAERMGLVTPEQDPVEVDPPVVPMPESPAVQEQNPWSLLLADSEPDVVQ